VVTSVVVIVFDFNGKFASLNLGRSFCASCHVSPNLSFSLCLGLLAKSQSSLVCGQVSLLPIFLFGLVSRSVGQFFYGAMTLAPLSNFLVVWSVRQTRFSSCGLWISSFLLSSSPGARLFCRTHSVYQFFSLLFRRCLALRSLVASSICPSG
jgi:hypothetical protein